MRLISWTLQSGSEQVLPLPFSIVHQSINLLRVPFNEDETHRGYRRGENLCRGGVGGITNIIFRG
jgi:hypothetical protein